MQSPTCPDKVGGRDAAGLALGVVLSDIDGDGYDDVLVGAPGGLEAMAVLVCGPVRVVEDEGDEPELSTISGDMVEPGLTVTDSYEVGAALAAPETWSARTGRMTWW